MAKDGQVSIKGEFPVKAKGIADANRVSDPVKDGNDNDVRSHGSRPAHINRPQLKK